MKPPHTTAPREPSLRQLMSFMGIEHSTMRARRRYFAQRDRTLASTPEPCAIPGIEVTHIDAAQVEPWPEKGPRDRPAAGP